ncbi:MAG: S8 family peptidase [Candidatus Sericytochromatia bacterium]|nr:S8 family peptidase [Candidatus Sericytochromatia bacterium]
MSGAPPTLHRARPRRWAQVLTPGVTALGVLGCAAVPNAPGGTEPTGRPSIRVTAPALLVKLTSGVQVDAQPEPLAAGLRRRDALAQCLAKVGWTLVQPGPTVPLTALRARLLASPGVVAVEPSRMLRAMESVPPGTWDDPRAAEQYTLARVRTGDAHGVTEGTPRTTIAIVDTGVDHRHPDLASRDGRTSRVVKGEDFVNLDGDPMDRNGHGTHCAGIAAATARNATGIVGQAPGVTILAVRVLGDNGAGSDAAVAAGIIHATDRGAGVISLSLGGPEPVKVIDDAVQYARARGVLLVAAMGNEGKERRSYPAANAGVLAVGATTAEDQLAAFSNTGPWIGLVAPGADILSTLPGGRYGLKSGTSMATPCVAGVAALVRDRRPGWSPDAVRAHLEQTAEDLGPPGFDARFGHGRLNAGRALAALR